MATLCTSLVVKTVRETCRYSVNIELRQANEVMGAYSCESSSKAVYASTGNFAGDTQLLLGNLDCLQDISPCQS